MRRILLWSGATLAVLVVAAIVALFVVDLSRFGPTVEAQASAALGREVAIGGGLEVGRSLTPTLAASDVTVANLPGGSRDEMARIGRLEVGLDLLALLGGTVRITHFVVVGADIILETGADGSGNWVFAPEEAVADEAVGSRAVSDEDGAPAEIPFIGRVEFRDSTVSRLTRSGTIRRLDIKYAILATESEEAPVEIEIDCVIDGLPVRMTATTGSLGAMAAGAADWPVDLALSIGDSTIDASGTIADPTTFASYRLDVQADLQSSDPFAALLGSALPQLSPWRIAGTVAGDQDAVSLSDLAVILGESDLAGDLVLSFAGDRPSLSGDLTAQRLLMADLRFGASEAEADGTEADAEAADAGDTEMEVPVASLDAADIDLSLSIGELVLNGWSVSDVRATLLLDNRRLEFDLAEARAFDGPLAANLVLDGAAEPAAVAVSAAADAFDMGAMLRALGVSDAVDGRANAALTLQADGGTVSALLAAVDGRATMNMGAGTIDSTLAGLVGRSALTALLPIGDTETETTPLQCAIAHFDIADGVATSTALLVDTEKATIAGEGAIDMRVNQMELVFSPRSKDPNLLALVAPVRLRGPINDPEVDVLTGDMVLNTATGLLLGAINPIAIVVPFVTTGSDEDNACLAALNDELETDRPSAPERIVGGAVDVVGGVAEGVGDAAVGVGEAIGDAIGGLFGSDD